MADISDVQSSLVSLVAGIAYPNGTSAPSAVTVPVTVFPGWPVPAQLDAALAAGIASVSVFPGLVERNTTRYPTDWMALQGNPTSSLTTSVVGQQVTIGGAMPSPFQQTVVAILVNKIPYPYSVLSSDTPSSIAAALAALIAVAVSGTTAAGAVVNVPAPAVVTAARVGTTGAAIKTLRTQSRNVTVGVWVNSPAVRDALAPLIDTALADIPRLLMPDGTYARLIYVNTVIKDESEKANLYRRDLNYSVEYSTTKAATFQQITQMQLNSGLQVTGAPVLTTYQ